jgi:hypothetical protein
MAITFPSAGASSVISKVALGAIAVGAIGLGAFTVLPFLVPAAGWSDTPKAGSVHAPGDIPVVAHSAVANLQAMSVVVRRDGVQVVKLVDDGLEVNARGSGAKPLSRADFVWTAEPGVYQLELVTYAGWTESVARSWTVTVLEADGSFPEPPAPGPGETPGPTWDPYDVETAPPLDPSVPPVDSGPGPPPPAPSPSATLPPPPAPVVVTAGSATRTGVGSATSSTSDFTISGVSPGAGSAYIEYRYSRGASVSGWIAAPCGLVATPGSSPPRWNCAVDDHVIAKPGQPYCGGEFCSLDVEFRSRIDHGGSTVYGPGGAYSVIY